MRSSDTMRPRETGSYAVMPKTSVQRRLKTFAGVILQRDEATWPLVSLCRLLPCKPAYDRLWRWCIKGRQHPYSRKRVRMEAIHDADGLSSSVEAYKRFLERLNEE